MRKLSLGRRVRAGSLALTILFAGAMALAISTGIVTSAAAQSSASSVRPPAGAATGPGLPVVITPQPSDSDNWRRIRQGISGYVSIPDRKAGVMIQSEGEIWRNVNNGPLKNYGAWLLLAVVVLLALFFAYRRRIPIEHGPSGTRIERFSGTERFAHWLLASCFVVLALTGLNITYGKFVLMPVIGKEAFAAVSSVGKLLHNYLAFAFMVGLVMIFFLWVKDNLPNKYDMIWLAKGGGLFAKSVHPPARKFNAGQKILFWLVIAGGVVLSVSGVVLLFPFLWTDIFGMQDAQLIHAVAALILVAVIIAHIYIGSLGMVGAFDAMGTGMVDSNWAKEHHSVWVEELETAGGSKS